MQGLKPIDPTRTAFPAPAAPWAARSNCNSGQPGIHTQAPASLQKLHRWVRRNSPERTGGADQTPADCTPSDCCPSSGANPHLESQSSIRYSLSLLRHSSPSRLSEWLSPLSSHTRRWSVKPWPFSKVMMALNCNVARIVKWS